MADQSVIRELITVFGFKVDEKKLKRFDAQIDNIKKNLRRAAIAGGILVGTITGIAVRAVSMGKSISDAANKLGMTTTQLQLWEQFAARAGIGTELLRASLSKLKEEAGKGLLIGGEAIRQKFAAFGIKLENARGEAKNLNTLISELVQLGSKMSESDKTGLLSDLLGGEGLHFLNLMTMSMEEIRKVAEDLTTLGAFMSPEQIALTKEADLAWQHLGLVVGKILNQLAEDLLPTIIKALKWLSKFIDENEKELVFALKAIGVLLAGLVVMFTAIATSITGAIVAAISLKAVLIGIGVILASFMVWLVGIAAIFLLLEDLYQGLIGGGDSITGMIVVLGRAYAKDIWAWVERLGKRLLAMPDQVFAKIRAFLKTLDRLLLGIPGKFMKLLEDAYDALPASMKDFFTWISGGDVALEKTIRRIEQIGKDAGNFTRTRGASIRQFIPTAGNRNVTNNLQATIYPVSGQSPEAIVDTIEERFGIALSNLNGLSP